MDSAVDYDLEMGLIDTSCTKLPGSVMFDTTFSKETATCGTPFSQASTAPSTPFRFHLPDPMETPQFGFFHAKYQVEPLESELALWATQHLEQEKAVTALESDLGKWAQQHVEIEKSVIGLGSDLGKWAETHVELEKAVTQLDSDLGKWAQEQIQAQESALKLKSDLGRWAQQHVVAESKVLFLQSELGRRFQTVVENEAHQVVSFGLKPLQSELGRWAQKMVEAETWLKARLPQDEQFLVDASGGLESSTNGLAYRKSKRVEDRELDVEGPTWGAAVDGIDEGDGWLKVGELYLPMALEGMCVLTPNPDSDTITDWSWHDCEEDIEDDEPILDGAALTPDGRVVDLDGGSPIFFSCDPALSSSHSCKVVTIKAAKANKAARHAQAACDVEAKAACSIDPIGIVRGAAALSPSPAPMNPAERLKLFHQKRNRRQGNTMAWATKSDEVICIDEDGKASLLLYLAQKLRAKRLCEKLVAMRSGYEIPGDIVSIDVNGVIQYE